MVLSAGTLLYRKSELDPRAEGDGGATGDDLSAWEVLLVHPSGAYNRKAPWSIPKGLPEAGEPPEDAARRETREETGVEATSPLVDLGRVRYRKSRKEIVAFAGPAPEGAAPRCASWEVDRAEFVPLSRARELLHPDQVAFLDRLVEHLAGAAERGEHTAI